MANFHINHLLKSQLDDDGVSVKELLELLDINDSLTIQLMKALNIEEYKEDFIKISGANKLVQVQKGINKRFYKEDIASSLNDIKVCNNEDFTLEFYNLNNSDYFSKLNISQLRAKTKYSSRNDFFSWYYGMDKYASELLKNGLDEVLHQNIELLKSYKIANLERKYRILYDSLKNEYYVRAIISMDRYVNYDNNITIVIALLSLHKKMLEEKIAYSLNRVEYNESCMKIFFEEDGKRKLGELGYVKNITQISNDEVKRESLKFEAISLIEFIDVNDEVQEIFIQPSFSNRPKVETTILAIAHNLGSDKFIKKLEEIENSEGKHNDLFSLISNVSEIKDPLQILHLVKLMVNNARSEGIKQYKGQLKRILETNVVNNMIQLLSVFKKMDLLTESDIEASEYVRYIIYQSLIEKKSTK